MELKRYQVRVLGETLDFLDRLATEQAGGNKRASLEAWEATRGTLGYRQRRNGLDRDLPDIWIKVPTGGGKTLLATRILGQIYSTIHRDRNGAGLALWVVPSDQIYKQTLGQLRDASHPYRHSIEQAVGRRVEVWEKHEATRIRPTHLRDALNIVMLKLPSANRQDKETLKLFRDSGGNIVQHFPAEDDAEAHRALVQRVPNLDIITEDLVKTSLGNLIRLCEPPVILDEGHRALSDLARNTLADFNPSILVQLSATPPKEANVLCRVTGTELLDEEMIKLPINVANSNEANWRTILSKANDRRAELAKAARRATIDGRPPLRPIVLVQVERTGKDQQGRGFVHAEDVKKHLMARLGVAEAEIAIKSSKQDDIEGIDLLDEGCPITWIITKSALQEGWDCPYAYILVSLSNTGSARAMTQLVGRVLRQPFTSRFTVPALNESYVFCRKAKAAEVVAQVKRALEQEGYEGGVTGVVDRSDGSAPRARPVAKMREQYRPLYRKFQGKVYLPRFCVKEKRGWAGLDYFRHLIAAIDVEAFDYASIDWPIVEAVKRAKETFFRVTLGDDRPEPVKEEDLASAEDDERARAWLVANLPFEHLGFRALRVIVDRVVTCIIAREPGVKGRVGLAKYALRERLIGFINAQQDIQTEQAFRELVAKKRIAFYLECIECRFELPPEIELRSTRRLTDNDNREVAKTLFEWAAAEEFNEYEREVALCIDKHPEVLWWYRNAVGRDCFSIQGYRRDRVYPDFVVQKGTEEKPAPAVVVVEAKGEHLSGNVDTEYKRDLGRFFEQVGRHVTWQELGEGFADATFRFQVLDQDDAGAWRDGLNAVLRSG